VVLTISLSFGSAEEETVEKAPAQRTEPPHFDFGLLPMTEPNTLYWNRKLRQAMTTMIAAGVRHAGYGSFSSDLGLLASLPNWSSTVWFWDHFISATAIGAFRPEWMTSAVRCILRHTSNERIGPGILLAFPPYGSGDHMVDCYAPIASWAVTKAWRAYGRRPDLETIYPLLAEHHEGWFRNCDRDGDGIPEWRNSGNPADDSPRFDPYAPAPGAACFELPPFPSADLCAYLLLDARCLKRFAQELGLGSEADRWEERADFLRRHLLERHWDEGELFFHDRTPDGNFHKVKTFFGLLPLWADPDLLPRETARAAIERHLLNPEEFWGEIPFPSVAYDEPTYDPLGYWRGRMWGHVYFWNTELLRLHGFEAEAEEARTRYLRIAAAHKESMENFPSDPAQLHHRTVRSYNWCGSVTAFFLLGWHRTPVQLEL
jgi:glycogen debranching enzyme